MATYGTDLVVIATGSDAESGTWTEFTGWSSGGTPGAETENFIQNTQSYSQSLGNATTGKSIAFDAGSDVSGSIPSGDVVMGWFFFGAGTNLYTYASGGHRFGIGASVANFDMWSVSGDDRQPNPYGGWFNVAVDPTVTPDYTAGTGSGGAWRYFGSLLGSSTLGVRVKVAKGNPHAVDGMLMGRGEIYCTGTAATFTGMAAQNDAIANRWGLLQDTGGGTFLWKGLMSFGQTATSTTFSDANKTIVIDDTAKVTSSFNKIELHNVSTSVTLTSITITAKGTVAPGNLEMIDDGTLAITGCSFINMGTFIFLSGATVASTTFNGCGQITATTADLSTSIVAGYEGTTDTGAVDWSVSTDPSGKLDDMTFTKGTAATHAIEFSNVSLSTVTIDNITFSGYGADASTSAELYFARTTGTITVNVSGMTTPTYKSAGATITFVSSYTLTVTNVPSGTKMTIVNSSTRTELDNQTSAGANLTYVHSGGETVDIMFLDLLYEPDAGNVYDLTLDSGNQSIKANLPEDLNYDNP